MRIKITLILLIVFFRALAQNPKVVIDSTAITIKEFKNASLLDSLLQKNFFDTNDIISNDSTAIVHDMFVHTDTLKKRLDNLNSRTPLDITYNPVIENLINNYLRKRRSSFNKLFNRAEYYFPLFEEVFDKSGIPLEIKYLAIVESALRPNVRSKAGASGLWQFMFSTARLFDLEVNSYIDDRFNPLKSTNAAAQYLQKLYDTFGDWNLSLAAYNAGPGNVTKAIRRSGGYTNYWNIRPFLPAETANYIPKFIAILYIFEYAEEHGFSSSKLYPSVINTDTVKIKRMVHFDHIKEILNVDIEMLRFYNPSYKLDIIPVFDGKESLLRLPIAMVGTFISNEAEIYAYSKAEFDKREKPLPKFYTMDSKIRYKVKSGDYLGKIAKKYNVTTEEIIRWNGLKSDLINIGDKLIIYIKN